MSVSPISPLRVILVLATVIAISVPTRGDKFTVIATHSDGKSSSDDSGLGLFGTIFIIVIAVCICCCLCVYCCRDKNDDETPSAEMTEIPQQSKPKLSSTGSDSGQDDSSSENMSTAPSINGVRRNHAETDNKNSDQSDQTLCGKIKIEHYSNKTKSDPKPSPIRTRTTSSEPEADPNLNP